MLTISVLCIAAVVVFAVILAILSIPIAIIGSLLPWALGVAGVVLLIKAACTQPWKFENFAPAIGAFILSALLRWIF